MTFTNMLGAGLMVATAIVVLFDLAALAKGLGL